MKKRFLFALSTLLIIITLAVPVFAQSTMDTVQALNKKGWKLEEGKIPGWWSFDSIYSHEIAYSEELENCRDLVIASAEKNDHPVGSLIFMTDEDKAFFDNVLGPTAMWDALARWNTTGILSINGVPWQNSPYRDEYLAALIRLYPAAADPVWQEYLLDPAWNGKLRAKVTYDPDRAEVYIGSKDIVIVRGNDTTNLELPSAVYTTGEEIMVPLRDVFENDGVGAKVIYNPLQKTIVVTSKDNTVTLQVGSTSVKVNGKTETISKAPTVVDGVTFVPVKFIAEKLGHVAWVYKDTKTNRTEIIIPRSAMAFLYDGVE